jgi:hypothetical protein
MVGSSASSPFDAAAVEPRGRVVDDVVLAAHALASAATDRRVILLVARRGADDEVGDGGLLIDTILRTKSMLWTVEIGGSPPKATGATVTARRLDDALATATAMGGALRRKVVDSTEVPAALAQIVGLLRAQYVVSYTWPDPMLSQVNLATRHDRGDVLAPVWSR